MLLGGGELWVAVDHHTEDVFFLCSSFGLFIRALRNWRKLRIFFGCGVKRRPTIVVRRHETMLSGSSKGPSGVQGAEEDAAELYRVDKFCLA